MPIIIRIMSHITSPIPTIMTNIMGMTTSGKTHHGASPKNPPPEPACKSTITSNA